MRTQSGAFSTPVRRSRNVNSESLSDASAFGSSSRTSINPRKDNDNFQSIMTFMMLQTKTETEQKNREIEMRKEEMRMHREEMGMQRQMINIMMIDIPTNSIEEIKQDDERKPAAKDNNKKEFGEGGAEC